MKNIYIIMLLLFVNVPINAMDYVKNCQNIIWKSFQKRISLLFERPRMTLQQPITIMKTPLESGTFENETENVIRQVNVELKLHNIDWIVECTVFVTNYDHKKRLLEVFKSKKFAPRNMQIKVIDLGGAFKVAIEAKIFRAPKGRALITSKAKL